MQPANLCPEADPQIDTTSSYRILSAKSCQQ